MTTDEIAAEEARLDSIEMGPERWYGESALKKAKAECADYKNAVQEKTFREWLKDLDRASKESSAIWDTEETRKSYYEGQPETWIDFYDEGDSAGDAVAEDMSYWDD